MSSSALTLLAFLSSGCDSCAPLWHRSATGASGTGCPRVRGRGRDEGPRVGKPGRNRGQRTTGVTVVMSTDAWGDYEVPGSPYFVLVDGGEGHVSVRRRPQRGPDRQPRRPRRSRRTRSRTGRMGWGAQRRTRAIPEPASGLGLTVSSGKRTTTPFCAQRAYCRGIRASTLVDSRCVRSERATRSVAPGGADEGESDSPNGLPE